MLCFGVGVGVGLLLALMSDNLRVFARIENKDEKTP